MTKKLLIYNSGGGIGDSIQLFPLILSLQNLFEKSEIYYLGAHENHFKGKLKEYKIVVTLNLYFSKYINIIATITPLEPVDKASKRKVNIIKYCKLLLYLSLRKNAPNPIIRKTEKALGFHITPLYLPEKINGLIIKPTSTKKNKK